jgi:protein-S-isoprenylcysteine O-methyltransferase Ste14
MIMIIVYIFLYVLTGIFFIVDVFYKRTKESKPLKKSKFDKGSAIINGIVFIVSISLIVVSPIMNYYKIGLIEISILFNIIGLLITVLGIILRMAAVKTLGKYFTRTLEKTENQQLITNGVYKYLRHPGAAGNMTSFFGLAVSTGNYISIIFVTVMISVAYIYRIKVEEEMLIEIFGDEYKKYQKKTKRLIPFLY